MNERWDTASQIDFKPQWQKAQYVWFRCSFLNPKERFFTPFSGSMTDFYFSTKSYTQGKRHWYGREKKNPVWFRCTLGFAIRWQVGISNLKDYNNSFVWFKGPMKRAESFLTPSLSWPGMLHFWWTPQDKYTLHHEATIRKNILGHIWGKNPILKIWANSHLQV